MVDVNGVFLFGEFKLDEKIYMKISHGCEKLYPQGGLLCLKGTLYGVKNAPKAFWRLLLGIRSELGYEQNHANPCLYYKWHEKYGLIVWLSFIDYMLIVCMEDAMESIKKKFTETVEFDDIGKMQEYIGTPTKLSIDQHNKTFENETTCSGSKFE